MGPSSNKTSVLIRTEEAQRAEGYVMVWGLSSEGRLKAQRSKQRPLGKAGVCIWISPGIWWENTHSLTTPDVPGPEGLESRVQKEHIQATLTASMLSTESSRR